MDDRLRASNADRDRAAALLCDHFVAGRLTRDELDDRLAAALGAATFGDLRRALTDLPGPGPALPHESRLERGYRRLLALYPARYRRVHEEEMFAVLMTAAADGQDRPGLAEAADLIIGALRVRCQALRGGVPGWRRALAVIGAAAVLGVLAGIPFASASPRLQSAIVRLADARTVNQNAQHTIDSTQTTLSRNRLPSPTSYPVMAGATHMLSSRCVRRPQWHHCRSVMEPYMSVHALRSHVHISILPSHEMVINAEAAHGRSAGAILSAVAGSYILYVSSHRFYRAVLRRHGKRQPAPLLYLTSAAPRSRSTDVLDTSGLGALCGSLIGAAIAAVALIPRRRRLRMA